jgi:hypothetical protein
MSQSVDPIGGSKYVDKMWFMVDLPQQSLDLSFPFFSILVCLSQNPFFSEF